MVQGPPEELRLPLVWLDTLWLQVTGTICNIACKHCFISCGPKVHTHEMMSVESVRASLDAAGQEGVRAIWFTGGEPFLHPQIFELMDLALAVGPLGVLTNGMLVDDAVADGIAERFHRGPYTLEVRISLDGCTREQNDRIRGKGVFDKACAGLRRLAERGVPALVAVSLVDDDPMDREKLLELLVGLGLERPRIKWIPAFRIGREERRGRGYQPWETIAPEDLENPEAPHKLQCGTSRTVTSNGVWPCPILINERDYRLADALPGALGPHRVDHKACFTCWQDGFTCST